MQTEKDNNKGADKRFILCSKDAVESDSEVMKIWFEYRPDERRRSQDAINKDSVQILEKKLSTEAVAQDLFRNIERSNGAEWTLMEKRLNDWTKRNDFDYFIHRDLNGFLKRELDFYIKNEVFDIDSILSSEVSDLEKRLHKGKAIKNIGDKIINFISQIEEFQKKLWLKKKFVVKSDYCLTLDRVPEHLYGEIAANDRQREEWVRLFSIDRIEDDLAGRVAYSKPLTVDFLKENRYLTVDTALFDGSFKYRVLGDLDNLDQNTDGLLIRSENFQALNFLKNKYSGQVRSVYIDPPYNTDASAILYKNNYKDASWLSLMQDRLDAAKKLMRRDGIICVAIDDKEFPVLKILLQSIFPGELGIAAVRSNPGGRKTKNRLAPSHEYALFYGKSEDSVPSHIDLPDDDERPDYTWSNFIRSGSNDKRADRPKLYYPLFVCHEGPSKGRIRVPSMEWNEKRREYDLNEEPANDETQVLPIWKKNEKSIEKNWHRGYRKVAKELASEHCSDYRADIDTHGEIKIKFKVRRDKEALPKTWWARNEYASASHGPSELIKLFGQKDFDFPKAKQLVRHCVEVSNGLQPDAMVLDFFAGSGTTGQAVIEFKRAKIDAGENGNSNQYILIEMGEYFDSVLKPRIQKAIYSDDWKDGKPQSRKGISHCFKTLQLESYEDTLNNLRLQSKDSLLQSMSDEVKEQYLLEYMLNIESRDSLFSISDFEHPFDYQLLVTKANETVRQNIDLVETLNYLLGLRVRRIKWLDEVLTVSGKNSANEGVLILWRDTDKMGNTALREWYQNHVAGNSTLAHKDLYVNGSNTLKGAMVIEQVFHDSMFD